MRVLSWNVLRWTGADAAIVGGVINRYHPDLVMLQEADARLDTLSYYVGGFYHRQIMPHRDNGLVVWTPTPLPQITPIPLPWAPWRIKPPRMAIALHTLDHGRMATWINVHLAHDQALLRQQALMLARSIPPNHRAIIIGDFNAVGRVRPCRLQDVGPRVATHHAQGFLPLRLDRCLVRGYRQRQAQVLPWSGSDHRPILIDLEAC